MGSSSSKLHYEPQPALLGKVTLDDDTDEVLLATFRFEPCEWTSLPFSSTYNPCGVGMTEGVGHLTTQRLLLFWDVERALSAETAEHVGELVGAAAEAVFNKAAEKVVEGLSHIGSRSRKVMSANASHYPKGIATWHIPEEMDDEEFLARDSFGCFFVVASKDLGPVNGLTFRPVFWDNDWGGDDIKEFEKILSEQLKIKARRIEKVVRGKDGLVKLYKT